jgi:hypothetical protein
MALKPPSNPAKAAAKKEQAEAKKREKKAKKEQKKAEKELKKKEGGGQKGLSIKKPSIKTPSLTRKKVTPGAPNESKNDNGLKKLDLFGKDAKAKNKVLEEEKATLENKTASLEGRLQHMSMSQQQAKQVLQQAINGM